jgi:flavin-dependent dehydrogenase
VEALRFDVAVVGAGPAGSTAAALLAQRGLSVALVDRDEFPRDKLCGEFLSYDALPVLDRLGVTQKIDDAGAPKITHCRIVGSKRTREFAFPHAARGVSRMFLDDLLFRNAQSKGAQTFAGWTATTLDARHVTIARENESRTIDARIVIGAWGRWGRFDAQLERGFVRDRSHRNFGFKRHYRAAVATDTNVIDLYSFKRGYLGVSAVERGITNICGLVHTSRLSGHKGRWDAFVSTIRAEEARLEEMYSRFEPAQEQFLSSEPVIFRARSPVERGVIMIGDASGVIDPLTGNGMAMAIQSAIVAAPHIVNMLITSDRTPYENAYRLEHGRMFGRRIAWSRRAAAILARPRLLDAALAAIAGNAIPQFLLAHTRGDRDRIERLSDSWFSC